MNPYFDKQGFDVTQSVYPTQVFNSRDRANTVPLPVKDGYALGYEPDTGKMYQGIGGNAGDWQEIGGGGNVTIEADSPMKAETAGDTTTISLDPTKLGTGLVIDSGDLELDPSSKPTLAGLIINGASGDATPFEVAGTMSPAALPYLIQFKHNGTARLSFNISSTLVNLSPNAAVFSIGQASGGTLNIGAGNKISINASGQIVFSSLPTSSSGLPSGAVWNDGGTLKIA